MIPTFLMVRGAHPTELPWQGLRGGAAPEGKYYEVGLKLNVPKAPRGHFGDIYFVAY